MTYDEIKTDMARRTGCSEADVDVFFDAFRDLAHTGAELNLPGLGEFKVVQRPARSGVAFGKPWTKPAHGAVRFSPFKAYRDAVE